MFRLGMGTLLALALLAGASDAQAQSCALCVDFVTTYDADGDGPVPARQRLQPSLIANVPYVLDVDGTLPPLPLGALPIVPGYELRATVQAIDAAKPTIILERLITPLPKLPVRVEVVQQDSEGIWKSFGYDALAASAPQSFRAAIDLSKTDHTHVGMTIGGPASELTLVNEQFKGDPVGARTARHIRRARFYGDGKTARVPGSVTLDLDTATVTHLNVSRDTATLVDFSIADPDGTRTTGTLSKMPAWIDLTIAAPDLDGDKKADTKLDYLAAAPVTSAVVRTQAGNQSTTATVAKLPSQAHLTFASPKADATAPKSTTITYHSNGRADHLNLVASETVTGGTHVLTADVAGLPKNIDKLAATDTADGGKQLIYDSDGQAGTLDVDDATRKGSALERTFAHVESLPADVTLTKAGDDRLHYDADGGVLRAHVETVKDPDTEVADTHDERLTLDLDSAPDGRIAGPALPDDVQVAVTRGPGEAHFTYAASGPIASAVINATNLPGLPAKVHNLNVAMGGVPLELRLDTIGRTVDDPPIKERYCPSVKSCQGLPEDCDFTQDPLEPGCERVPTKTTTRSEKTSLIELTAPRGRLGSAAVQLTDHQALDDERLPATAYGKPQDGAIIRDLESFDRYLVDVRLTGLAHAVVRQVGNRMREVVDSTGQTLAGNDTTTMHLGLDADAPGHVLGFNQQKRPLGSNNIKVTRALLAGVPHPVALDTVSSNSGTRKQTVQWTADQRVDGFCPTSGGPQCAIDESPIPGFLYEELDHLGDDPNLVPRKRLELAPMPRTLRVCQMDLSSECTPDTPQGKLFDENIERLAAGWNSDTHDCFPDGCLDVPMPISPDEVTASVLIEASDATRMQYVAPGTDVLLRDLRRWALQGFSEKYPCLDDRATCQRAYLGMDTHADVISGEIFLPDSGVHFRFPPGFMADRHVWAAWQNSPVSGFVASAGPIECPHNPVPNDTVIDPGAKNVTEQFCYGDVFGEGDDLDFDF